MGKPTGFMEFKRETPTRPPVTLRLLDWKEVYDVLPDEGLRVQGARCARADQIGGLLIFGIPEFKLEKRIVQRSVNLLEEEGVKFVTDANVGLNVKVEDLRRDYDAIVLCGGATKPRDLPVPGREL